MTQFTNSLSVCRSRSEKARRKPSGGVSYHFQEMDITLRSWRNRRKRRPSGMHPGKRAWTTRTILASVPRFEDRPPCAHYRPTRWNYVPESTSRSSLGTGSRGMRTAYVDERKKTYVETCYSLVTATYRTTHIRGVPGNIAYCG